MAEPMTYVDCHYDDERHVLLVASRLDRYDDREDVRVSAITHLHLDGSWGCGAMEGIRACSVARSPSFTWVVGTDGDVWTYPREKSMALDDRLPEASHRARGPSRIRVIDGHPYVRGLAGVSTLQGGRWLPMNDGLTDEEASDVETIHGTAQDDLYVVGAHGLLARWNGSTWSRIALPTSSAFHGVRAFARDHVVAVGHQGALVAWTGADWRVERVPGQEQTALSDVERFNEALYVAAGERLFVRIGATWDELPIRSLRLAVGDGRLWAMAPKRVHSFDGQKWHAHLDPDND